MEERQVTSDGETRALPYPFFVIATQNPIHQVGTFPLPESQLDRFLLSLQLGYPDRESERALLAAGDQRRKLDQIPSCLDAETLRQHQESAEQIFVSPALLDYVQNLLEASRLSPLFHHGLSPRAGLSLLAVSRAWAYLEGRKAVLPDDVQAMLPGVACHRLRLRDGNTHAHPGDVEVLIRSVPIP
jgi:MoxR-like ATPase